MSHGTPPSSSQSPPLTPLPDSMSNPNLRRCADCGREVSVHAESCPNCGATFVARPRNTFMFCSSCGKQLSDQAIMCPGCGAPTKLRDAKLSVGIGTIVARIHPFGWLSSSRFDSGHLSVGSQEAGRARCSLHHHQLHIPQSLGVSVANSLVTVNLTVSIAGSEQSFSTMQQESVMQTGRQRPEAAKQCRNFILTPLCEGQLREHHTPH